jgi:ribonuclease Z
MTAVSVTILGTGNPIPDPNRAGSATLVHVGSTRLLIDAGRGVLMRLAATGTFPIMLDAVLLTHLHSDHITDLNDVITTHWVMSQQPTPLHIYGPERTRDVVAGILAMLAPDVRYRLAHHLDLDWEPIVEVHEITSPVSITIGDATIVTQPTDHRPVEPTIGYRISGGGKSVAIAGDTIPCSGLDLLCADADVYVQTVIRDDLVRLVPSARFRDILDYHSTMEQAAQTAERNRVARLVCTHYVPAKAPGDDDAWRDLATRHFAGEVILADDLTRIDVG